MTRDDFHFHTDDDVKRYIDFVMEDSMGQFKGTFEILDDIREKVDRIPAIEANIAELKSAVTVHDLVIREHDHEIKTQQTTAHTHV